MRIVLEFNKKKAEATTQRVAQGTAVVVSGLFSLIASTVVTGAEVGKATYNELKSIK